MARIDRNLLSNWRHMVVEYVRTTKKYPAAWLDSLRPDKAIVEMIKKDISIISALWETFTQERANIPRYLMDPKKQVYGYLLGFHLPNAVRSSFLWKRFFERFDFSTYFRKHSKNVQFIDLGCGTGAMSQSFMNEIMHRSLITNKHDIEITLVDRVKAFLDTSKSGLEFTKDVTRIFTKKGGLETILRTMSGDKRYTAEGGTTILGLGYVWNELKRNPIARSSFFKFLDKLQAAKKDVFIVLLEPANSQLSRDTMMLRDELDQRGIHPLYPCSFHSAPCPMLERKRDWCFSEMTLSLPNEMKFLDKKLGIDHTKLNSSAFLFASSSVLTKMKPVEEMKDCGVVVGRPKISDPKTKNSKERPRRGRGPDQFQYLVCSKSKLTKIKPKKDEEVILRGESLPKN